MSYRPLSDVFGPSLSSASSKNRTLSLGSALAQQASSLAIEEDEYEEDGDELHLEPYVYILSLFCAYLLTYLLPSVLKNPADVSLPPRRILPPCTSYILNLRLPNQPLMNCGRPKVKFRPAAEFESTIMETDDDESEPSPP